MHKNFKILLLTKKIFSEKILEWYSDHRRDLPWRKTKDPYKVWVSEIILQQTRVDQGLPYYQKFIKAFPNVKALAAANQEVVLRLWQGLGYYSRARNSAIELLARNKMNSDLFCQRMSIQANPVDQENISEALDIFVYVLAGILIPKFLRDIM